MKLIEEFIGDNSRFIWNDGFCIDGENVWFIGGAIRVLFCMKVETGEIISYHIMPGNFTRFRDYSCCYKVNNKIVCIPDCAKELLFYSLDENVWSTMALCADSNIRHYGRIIYADNNSILMYSLGMKTLFEIDTEKENVIRMYTFDSEYIDCFTEKTIIYFLSKDGCHVCCFDYLKWVEMKKTMLPSIDDTFTRICVIDGKLWMTGYKNKVYRYVSDNVVTQINVIRNEIGTSDTSKPFAIDILAINNEIWIVPFMNNDIVYIDTGSNNIGYIHIDEGNSMEGLLLGHRYLVECCSNNVLMLYSLCKKDVIKIDMIEKSYIYMEYDMETIIDELEYVYAMRLIKESSGRESESVTLRDFIEII